MKFPKSLKFNLKQKTIWISAGLALTLSACQNLQTNRPDLPRNSRTSDAHVPPTSAPVVIPQSPQVPELPLPRAEDISISPALLKSQGKKVALIIGPGGAKSFAAMTVIQALQDEKIFPTMVTGIEWGALVASIYAKSSQYSELEWQSQRFTENWLNRKSLMSKEIKSVDAGELSENLRKVFGDLSVESMRIRFLCPSLNLATMKISFLNRGPTDQVVQSCLGYPPHGQTYGDYIAGTKDIKILADHLRSLGAEVIILVNVIPTATDLNVGNGIEKILWSEVGFNLNFYSQSVNEVISLPTRNYDMTDFDRKREMMNEFRGIAQERVRAIRKKWRL